MSAVLKLFGEPEPVHHAHLLRDSHGRPYGISVSTPDDGDAGTYRMVIRGNGDTYPTLFHAIPKARAPWAKHSAEMQLLRLFHNAKLEDRGLNFRDCTIDAAFWRTFHGLRIHASAIINTMLAELYAEIPADLLRVVRRYPMHCRGLFYGRLSADGPRAWQLADTFPWLAVVVYDKRAGERTAKARALVQRGARPRDIAAAVDGVRVPMAFCRFKPAVMWHVRNTKEILLKYPELVAHHCPDTVPKQRAWLQAIGRAESDLDYATWVAKNFDRIGHWRMVPAIVSDVRDWVQDTCQARAIDGIEPETTQRLLDALRMTGDRSAANMLQVWYERCRNAKGRPFDPRMAPHTVLRLSREWHDRQAESLAAKVSFHDPWYDSGEIGEYSIVPIATAAELSHHGHALHNCASSYAWRIAQGESYLYAVTEDDKPIAMLELVRGDPPRPAQLKGPCNQAVAKPVSRAVHTWLRRQRKANGNGRMPTNPGFPSVVGREGVIDANCRGMFDDVDDDIPF